ncbi:MAG: NAD(P)/FAD-dependent oxidoreductase, partial [Sciscionella sp.]
MLNTIAVIGAGQVAAVATRTLRRRGFDGRIEIIGDEPHRPYQRPPLSKEYLENGDASELFLLPEPWCEEHEVRLRLGVSALRVRRESGTVELCDGSEVDADAVLIATGGRPRKLPEASGDRVHYLRSLSDSDRLRERLRPGARVIVIGAGFIGAEVAATARSLGAEVVIVEAMDTPLHNLLGGEIGAACGELHRRNGVE